MNAAFTGCYSCLSIWSRCFLGLRVCRQCESARARGYPHGNHRRFNLRTPLLCQHPSIDSTRTALVTRPNTSLWDSVKNAPLGPGVYMFRDGEGRLLYVGKSKTLRNRVRSYFAQDTTRSTGTQPAAGLSRRIELMTKRATSVEYVVTKSEAAALALEASLVKEHMPPYNILLKDDARYPSVCITFSEKYPRILLTRNRQQDFTKRSIGDKDRIYGPFVDSGGLRRLLWALNKAFPLRQRATPLHRDRPCINYEIGCCPGICQELISDQEYMATVKSAEMVLTGRVREAMNYLEKRMTEASDALDFEKASEWRDRIVALQSCFAEDDTNENTTVSQGVETSAMLGRDRSVSRDIAAAANCPETSTSVIILFQVRDGKVVNKLAFNVGTGQRQRRGRVKDEVIGRDILVALEQHYSNSRDPLELPEEIVIAEEIEEEGKATLSSFLSERRGKPIRIRTVRPNARLSSSVDVLVDAVQRNARYENDRASDRLRALERDLNSLRELLKPYVGSFSSSSKLLNLRRIECYDVSHISGASAVASRAVFINGNPTQALYRRYRLRDPRSSNLGSPNDYQSLKEALTQRFTIPESKDSNGGYPDLIVIDGGKGQLSAALEVLKHLNIRIPTISLAKRIEEVFVPSQGSAVNMRDNGQIEMTDGVRLLCRIRDEAHRWAIQEHRRLRERALTQSSLDQVAGLGPGKREVLLKYFTGSVKAVATASKEDLRGVEGIGDALADRIYKYYHSE